MKKLFLLPLAALAFTACSDDEGGYVEPIEQISEGTVLGTAETPLGLGGSNQQNAVYVDLSGETTYPVARNSWDLGFYSGSTPRVVINGALAMAAKKLETTDITLVQEVDATVAVGTFQAENMAYVDNPTGELTGTVFGDIATSEATASVYLVNLGNSVPTTPASAGSVNTAGTPRGWKKVKVWASATAYTVQFADLDATTAQTVTLTKDTLYNFTFLSLTSGTTVAVEPQAADWDLSFTTFTNEVFQETASAGAYFYSDYVVSNTKGGVTAVAIDGNADAYNALTLSSFNSGGYVLSTDQRAIGEHWRDVFTRTTYEDVFFVVKDPAGNLYKIRFLSMLSADGERGFPSFQYALLQ
jgi:HmuY protein